MEKNVSLTGKTQSSRPDDAESTEARIRVLVADQGALGRRFLINLLEADSQIDAVGFARSVEDLSRRVEQFRPDALVWNNGFFATGHLHVPTELRNAMPLLIMIYLKEADSAFAFGSLQPGVHDLPPDRIASMLKQLCLRKARRDRVARPPSALTPGASSISSPGRI